jgi:hypothetical protein
MSEGGKSSIPGKPKGKENFPYLIAGQGQSRDLAAGKLGVSKPDNTNILQGYEFQNPKSNPL